MVNYLLKDKVKVANCSTVTLYFTYFKTWKTGQQVLRQLLKRTSSPDL